MEETTINKVLVFYIGIGNLPSIKAEAYVKYMAETLKIDNIPKNVLVFFIPVRRTDTEIKLIDIDGTKGLDEELALLKKQVEDIERPEKEAREADSRAMRKTFLDCEVRRKSAHTDYSVFDGLGVRKRWWQFWK